MNIVHKVTMVHQEAELTTPRQRRRQAKIDDILDTALRIVYKKGLSGLTIQSLARELDWAQGALYRYFPNKDGLLAAMETRVLKTFQEELFGKKATTEINGNANQRRLQALGRILTMGKSYMQIAEQKPHAFGLIAMMVADPHPVLPDSQAEELISTFRTLLSALAELFEQAVASDALQPGDNMRRALSYWLAIHGILQMKKYARFGDELFEPEALFEHTVVSLLTGWGAQEKTIAKTLKQSSLNKME